MKSYETYITMLRNLCTSIDISFSHGRYEDLNAYQGDFPLCWCLPLRYDIQNLQSQVFSAGFGTTLVFFVKSNDNIDRTAEADLNRINECDEICSNFLKKLQKIDGVFFQNAQLQAYPLENSSSFVLTAITMNLDVKTSYNVDYCL